MIDVQHIKGIIRRRIVIFLVTSIPVFLIATVVAFLLPPIYESKSTILIESQQIPQEYVRTTITGYVEQRLQSITQQILSRSNLINIINQFNLYPEMRKKYATEIVIDKMRQDINLERIEAGSRAGRDTTIAFTLSYEGRDPDLVQKVTNILGSLYLEENLKTREAQATRTTEFLQQELNHLKEQIDKDATKISNFENAHIGELPEYATVNAQTLEQLRRDFDQAVSQISSLEDRKVYLEGQLASLRTSEIPVSEDGRSDSNPWERLKSLQLELVSMKSRLSEKHPDVVKLQREIQDLQNQLEWKKTSTKEEQRLSKLKNDLVSMRARLGEHHPEVVELAKEIASLSEKSDASSNNSSSDRLIGGEFENPAYISLKTQIDTIDLEIKHLSEEKINIKKKMAYYQKRIEGAPKVAKEYESMLIDYNNAKEKYNDIMSKLMEAKVARGMEQTQHGERFTIIEPANRPGAPEKPDRRTIMLMGLFLACGIGGGFSFLMETMDHSIKATDELDEMGHIPVLSSIPLMETDEEMKRRHKRIIIITTLFIGGLCIVMIAIHVLYMPLDILWYKIQNRMMINF